MFLKKKPLSRWQREGPLESQLTRLSVSSYLSPWGHGVTVLYPIDRDYCGFLGAHHSQLTGACRHVLVLFSKRTRSSCVVEEMDYTTSNYSVYY